MIFIFKAFSCFIFIMEVHKQGVDMRKISLSRLKILDGIPVQGEKDFQFHGRSLLECVSFCIQSVTCDMVYFDDAILKCTGIHEVYGLKPIDTTTFGALYKTLHKKTCRNTGYTYLPEIDTCLRFYKIKATWSEARSTCLADAGDLVFVGTQNKEVIFLPKLYEASADTSHRWWIGLEDQAKENHFVWVTGAAMTYTHWGDNQPDNDAIVIQNADCVFYLFQSSDNTYAWYDYDCGGRVLRVYFVCENQDFD